VTPPELFYSFILAVLGGIICILVCNKRESVLPLLIFFELSYWMRWAFAYLNNVLQFWAQKDLSDFSLSMIDQPGGIWDIFVSRLQGFAAGQNATGNQAKFFLEALVNLPALRLLEESITTLILTNCFIGAISGVVVFAYLTRIFDKRIATVGFLLTSLYPCAVNFSIFALRDLFLYFFVLLNMVSLTWLLLRKDRRILQGTIYIFSFICILVLRTALFPFALAIPGWLFLLWVRKTFARFRIIEEKRFIIAVAAIVIPALTATTLYVGYYVVLRQIGYSELVSPDEILANYTMNRYNRNTGQSDLLVAGSGGGSDVLPPSIYRSAPLPVRLGAQVVGMWMIPMPWLLTSITRMLALSDTIFCFAITFWAFGTQRLIKYKFTGCQPHQCASVLQYPKDVLRVLNFGQIFTFMSLMFCFGLLVSNSGNAFRMRLCAMPFIIPSASIYFSATYSWIAGRFVRTAMSRKRQQVRRGSVPTAVTASAMRTPPSSLPAT